MENDPTQSPHRLGRYMLGVRLAVGGMAEVWLARQDGPANFQKQLVVKKILPQFAQDEHFVEMFLNEARLAALLNHPNVVQIFELGEDSGTYFIVMEFIHGRNLRVVQKRCREQKVALPFEYIAQVMAGACEGLHYAHQMTDERGQPLELVHRDISPDNVIVSFDGQPKVVDFGIAKAFAAAGLTAPGTLKGKYAYMSPEQAMGKPLDRRADVYAVGVVLYELFSGRRPFVGHSEMELIRSVVEEPPPPLRTLRQDVPEPLLKIVERAMAKQKEDRYPDARSLGQDLEAYLRTTSYRGAGDVAAFMDKMFGAERDQLRQMGLYLTPGAMKDPLATPISSSKKTPAAASPDVPVNLPNPPTAATVPLTPRDAAGVPPPPPSPRRLNAIVLGAAAIALVALGAGAAIVLRPKTAEPAAVPIAQPVQPVATAPATTPPEPPAPQPPVPPAATPPVSTPPGSTAAASTPPAVAPAPADPEPAATSDAPAAPDKSRPTSRVKSGAAGMGHIVLRVNPWADVTIDGRHVGVTPFAPVEAAPGRHTVTLVNPDLSVTRKVNVNVRAGKDAIVRVDLLE